MIAKGLNDATAFMGLIASCNQFRRRIHSYAATHYRAMPPCKPIIRAEGVLSKS